MLKEAYLFSTSSHPQAINIQSLDITYLSPEINFDLYDYFIFTSKEAIKSLQNYKNHSFKPALCISEKTAEFYISIGGEVLEIGEGRGHSLVSKIQKFSKTTRWLYLRAKEIASDFADNARGFGFCIDEKNVYESKCSQALMKAKICDDGILIFTSPSSVKCFLQNHTISLKNKVIVIGETTARELPKEIEALVAPYPTIQSCIDLVSLV